MKTVLFFHRCKLWYLCHPLDFNSGSKFEISMLWHIIGLHKIAWMQYTHENIKKIMTDCSRTRYVFCLICYLCYLCIFFMCWEHEGLCVHGSPGKPGMLNTQDCPCKGNWRLITWWSVFFVGSSHIKLLQPGPEVANNTNNPYFTCITRCSSKLPELKLEIPTSLNDSCLTCIARGYPRLPQPRPEMANCPNDLCVICIIETRQGPSLDL